MIGRQFGMKKTEMMKVPVEFLPVLEQAKREVKFFTGKKKATNADGFRFIASSSTMFGGKKQFKLSFEGDE